MSRRRWAGRRAAISLGAPLLSLALDSACFGPPNVGFNLSVPSSIAGATAWIEIGAFPGACPSDTELEGGIAMEGPVARVVFSARDSAKPAFGDLPKATYGFAAVARAADCSVIGVGCSVVNVSNASAISIKTIPVPAPRGACEPGNTCVAAVCLAEGDSGAGPAGCSLSFVGAGPLADPLGVDATLLSPPAIVATNTGFLLAYREFDPSSGSARISLLPVDDAGGAGTPQQITLENRCPESPETDGTGLAWNGSSGAVAVSKHACPSSPPGVDIFGVDSLGVSTGGGFSPSGSSGLLLSQAHALSFAPQGLLLTHIDTVTRVAAVTAIDGTSLGTSTFGLGGLGSVAGAFVTATGSGTGLLSLGTAVGEGGLDASADPPLEGGAPLYATSFTSVGSGGSLSSLPAANDFSASWASLGSVDSRILVATSGTATSNPIFWYAFDVGVVTPAYVDSFAPQVTGTVAFADVALHGDDAFFAAQVGDGVSLFAFRKASTYPELLVEKDFADDVRIPIATIRDGLVAVAADATRVAVVWGTGRRVSALEDLGGYAVFSCVP